MKIAILKGLADDFFFRSSLVPPSYHLWPRLRAFWLASDGQMTTFLVWNRLLLQNGRTTTLEVCSASIELSKLPLFSECLKGFRPKWSILHCFVDILSRIFHLKEARYSCNSRFCPDRIVLIDLLLLVSLLHNGVLVVVVHGFASAELSKLPLFSKFLKGFRPKWSIL